MTQLDPPIPLDTPKGPAYAHLAIDYGQEHYLLFVCFVNETGECWIFPNREVRIQKNVSMGIRVHPAVNCDRHTETKLSANGVRS